MNLEATLSQKGWPRKDIKKTMKVYNENHPANFTREVESWIFVIVLLLGVFAIFAVSIFLIPVLIILEASLLFLAIILN